MFRRDNSVRSKLFFTFSLGSYNTHFTIIFKKSFVFERFFAFLRGKVKVIWNKSSTFDINLINAFCPQCFCIGEVLVSLLGNMVLNLYSIFLLTIITVHSIKNREDDDFQDRLYLLMLQITILLLFVDILSRFDGGVGTIFSTINHLGNFFIFLLSPVLPVLWLTYVGDQVYKNVEKDRRWIYLFWGIMLINGYLVVMNKYTGWLYYIDDSNFYHRGPLYLLPVLLTCSLIAASYCLLIVNRRKLVKKRFLALISFAIPPVIGIVLQAVFYGIPFALNCVALSLLIVYLNIQNRSIYTDYLTEVHNRKKLDAYLKAKIATSSEKRTFSAIMVDLLDFKSINDTYGHDVGDKALQIAAKILCNSLRANDFIARFGGDEFWIILDISDRAALEVVVERINSSLAKYNEDPDKPFALGFSMGYAVYDYKSHMSLEEFQKHIDTLMYKAKQAAKKLPN